MYDPYGGTTIEHRDGANWVRTSVSKYGNPLLWQSQRYDAGVKLYHFAFRTYSPQLGRWLQRDPLGYVDGVNLYAYVRSRPTFYVDSLGLVGEGFVGPPVPDWLRPFPMTEEEFLIPPIPPIPDEIDLGDPRGGDDPDDVDSCDPQSGDDPVVGGQGSRPGRDHDRKSKPQRQKRFRDKQAKKKEQERQECIRKWRVWDSLPDEVRKLRPEQKPDCDRPPEVPDPEKAPKPQPQKDPKPAPDPGPSLSEGAAAGAGAVGIAWVLQRIAQRAAGIQFQLASWLAAAQFNQTNVQHLDASGFLPGYGWEPDGRGGWRQGPIRLD